jgi:hypothetical protein
MKYLPRADSQPPVLPPGAESRRDQLPVQATLSLRIVNLKLDCSLPPRSAEFRFHFWGQDQPASITPGQPVTYQVLTSH